MNQATSIAILVVGIILLAFGLDAYHSASSDASRLFTGAPSGKALFLLLGGFIVAIAGFSGLARR